ncbi:MAG: cytidylate kinase [Crocinitomicaceae bacterium]|jgi:cytidylate kinase
MKQGKKIITIAGKLGSGKSSAAKKLASMLSLDHFSSGDFLREVAMERGLTIKELIIAAESDTKIDHDVDQVLRDKGDKENLIIDSRLAFHWIPESFKVYLEIDPDLAASRMLLDLDTNESRQQSEHAVNIKEMKVNMLERHESDVRRYKNLYGIDHTNHDNFDLVIDTGLFQNDLDSVVKKIIEGYLVHLKGTE